MLDDKTADFISKYIQNNNNDNNESDNEEFSYTAIIIKDNTTDHQVIRFNHLNNTVQSKTVSMSTIYNTYFTANKDNHTGILDGDSGYKYISHLNNNIYVIYITSPQTYNFRYEVRSLPTCSYSKSNNFNICTNLDYIIGNNRNSCPVVNSNSEIESCNNCKHYEQYKSNELGTHLNPTNKNSVLVDIKCSIPYPLLWYGIFETKTDTNKLEGFGAFTLPVNGIDRIPSRTTMYPSFLFNMYSSKYETDVRACYTQNLKQYSWKQMKSIIYHFIEGAYVNSDLKIPMRGCKLNIIEKETGKVIKTINLYSTDNSDLDYIIFSYYKQYSQNQIIYQLDAPDDLHNSQKHSYQLSNLLKIYNIQEEQS